MKKTLKPSPNSQTTGELWKDVARDILKNPVPYTGEYAEPLRNTVRKYLKEYEKLFAEIESDETEETTGILKIIES